MAQIGVKLLGYSNTVGVACRVASWVIYRLHY